MRETVIARRHASAPVEGWGTNATITATAKLYSLGEQAPYFSITAEIKRPGRRDVEACGCLHEEIAKSFPEFEKAIELHLSDADGVPMHSVANAWFFMQHVIGQREPSKYDRAQTPDDYLSVWANHVRVSIEDACTYRDQIVAAGEAGKKLHDEIVESFKPRWKAEADAVTAWLKH